MTVLPSTTAVVGEDDRLHRGDRELRRATLKIYDGRGLSTGGTRGGESTRGGAVDRPRKTVIEAELIFPCDEA